MTLGSSTNPFSGASLRFVRHLLGAKPRWPSAQQAALELPLRRETPVPMGAVCFYDTSPYGHCGLYIDRGWVLTHDLEKPVLRTLTDPEWGGPMLGWVAGKVFMAESLRKSP